MAPAYKLTYFDVTGKAEPIRFLFKYGNIEFEDNRIARADWPDHKPNILFGQLPLLEHDGKVVNQSLAIGRYVAKQVKLVGKDDWEDLEIDSTVDTISDLRNKILEYIKGDTDEKEKLKETLFKETVPFYLERLDAQVKKNHGYFVGGHLTWADVMLASIFDSVIVELKEDIFARYENLTKLKKIVCAIPSIKAWIDVRPEVKF